MKNSMKAAIVALATASAISLSISPVLALDAADPIKNSQNELLGADNFGRMVMIATLTELSGKTLSKGKEEKVSLPMTVSLSEKMSGGTSIQCVQICTVIGGVPICVCI